MGRGKICAEIEPPSVLAFDHAQRVLERGRPGVADGESERDGQADVGGDVEHGLQCELVVAGQQVGYELDQAAAAVLDAARDGLDLDLRRVVAGDGLSARGFVQCQSRRREAQRAAFDSLGRELAHQGQVLGVAGSRSTPR